MNRPPAQPPPPPGMIRRALTSRLFRVLVSGGLIAYMFARFEVGTVFADMLDADRGLAVGASLMFILSGVLGAMQWGIILRFHGIFMGAYGTVSRYFMGLFFNFILPGFIGGDVIRVYKTAAASGRSTQAFSSTLADRVIGLLVLVLFSFGAFFLMPEGPAASALPVALLMFVVLAGFILIFSVKRLGRLLRSVFGGLIPEKLLLTLRTVYLELHDLTRAPGTLAGVIALSTGIQCSRIAVHWLAGMAVGIELGFSYYALFVPLMAIAASLPISIGGFGVREAFAVVLFASAGVVEETVLAYTLLATVMSFLGSLPGAAAFVFAVGERPGR